MSVWYVLPSAREAQNARTVLEEWKIRGYKIATIRQGERLGLCDIEVPTDFYGGWPMAIHHLVKTILLRDPDMRWCVAGGDDQLPDWRYNAGVIATQVEDHFMDRNLSYCDMEHPGAQREMARQIALHRSLTSEQARTLGVMQPTGDRYSGDGVGADIDTAAASPWMGREWCHRAYQGNGPMFREYHHFYADTELQRVADMYGVFWQAQHWTQEHKHWSRTAAREMPSHMVEPNQRFNEDRALFQMREGLGWPGHNIL